MMHLGRRGYLFTSESVTEGHPDKVADRISDALLDAYLERDPQARVACETLVTGGRVVVAGEVRSRVSVDEEAVVRKAVREAGYDDAGLGFDADTVAIEILRHGQAAEIGAAVDRDGAGDQGLMFGYACEETPELMPLPIMLAHRIARRLGDARRSGELSWLRPDGKSQVSVEYRDGEPARVAAVVVSCQHAPGVRNGEIEETVRETILPAALGEWAVSSRATILVNPSGSFTEGGPAADTGLTGRKIIVDTYGGAAPHGGGAFSGKDPTKVDRSASYMARHIAKAVVAAGLAPRALVQLAYAIGRVDPVSVSVFTDGKGQLPDGELERLVVGTFDLTPRGIIEYLNLARPIYTPTSAYGHFGRQEEGFTWEDVGEAAGRLAAGVTA